MIKIDREIKKIEIQALYRSTEITQMFSQLNLLNDKEDEYLLEKYFMARSVVVFTYGTLEKFIKESTASVLKVIIENEYFHNNTKDFLCILKSKNKPMELFSLLMFYKKNSQEENKFEYNADAEYFSGRASIDSTVIANIVEILNLNDTEPFLRIPKLTIDSLGRNRMCLAHGDYYGDLKNIFGENRSNLTMRDIDEIIINIFKLTDNTKNDLIDFIREFKEKVVSLLKKVDEYKTITGSHS